ncbi:MAG: succinyl-diaminopimelate desuccinylase [Fimbriimonadaceae bacterium]|nr:succinyl-diaminopimelate desuccinylase [Alphaproteobacteria bacterium]
MPTEQLTHQATEIAQELIRCRSVTPDDGGALDYLERTLSAAGFSCHRVTFSDENTPDIENLFARIGDQGPHLAFAGHTDVVPTGNAQDWSSPPFAGEIRDGLLYGRGAVDMKGAIAAFVAATLGFLGKNAGAISGSISFLITGDEEGPAINGTKKLLEWAKERGEVFDHCIVGEPTNPNELGDTIKIGRRGSLSGTLTVRGQQGHVAYPHLAANPVPVLASMIAHISNQPLDSGTEHFQASNLEFIDLDVGNLAWNVIPGAARARFNMRYNDLWSPQSLETWLQDHLNKFATDRIRYTLTFEPAVSDVFLTKPGPLVEIMSQAIKSVTGRTPELTTGGGTSDARFIKDYCPVIEFGLVGQTMHKIDEHVDLADLAALTDIYQQTITEYFRKTTRSQPRQD